MVMRSPPRSTVSPRRAVIATGSTLRLRTPATQGLPVMRAITPAWLVMPPRAVRMPVAAFMPSMSAGPVSLTTRMTWRPLAFQRAAHGGIVITAEAGRQRLAVITLEAGMQHRLQPVRTEARDGLLFGPGAALDTIGRRLQFRRSAGLIGSRREEGEHALVELGGDGHVPSGKTVDHLAHADGVRRERDDAVVGHGCWTHHHTQGVARVK